ncbi:hypothetical protein SAMN05216503_3245 [Polaribacter sp. KT25b]|uniref:hypothetical protein n=1 Tax=Polaribacter sp. KT25b TaxID=1855336 RepID=UPI00087D2BA0|nr:hypothetical protein [Polaribacter sp. KT25b]SDS49597.1 hypothetical protein SAMN05216503_3245 [Polaribacter sp. KT25b]
MELSKEQLLQIDNYISACGIKFYDVRAEIVDHFANILEQKLIKNPDLDFKKEIENIHRNFSDRGFSKLLKEKTKSVQKKFYKQSLKHLITFFKLPKIIISGALFYTLFLIMNLFEDKEFFFQVLTGFGFLYIFIFFFSLFIKKKKKKELFLVLDMNTNFFNIINNTVIWLNVITSLRTSESFFNPIHNIIQLTFFVLFILFLWSASNVFYQNKKQVKEQYPNVIV